MLRRKLLLIMTPLVLLLVGTTVTSVWLLQGVLEDLRHVKEAAWVAASDVNELSVRVQAVQLHLYELQTSRSRRLDPLIDEVEAMARLVERLGRSYLSGAGEYREPYSRIVERFPEFRRHVGALATAQDASLARQHNERALEAAVAMQQDALPMARIIHRGAQQEQEALLTKFRWLVLGMALLFLLTINIAVVVLLRTASMILRPVDRLVEATRQLAAGKYDVRVKLDCADEFGELASACNHLAGKLQDDEKERLETLAQVARTISHEINNAASIIEMQLRLMQRHSSSAAQTEKGLQQIHESLERMTRTVQALAQVRRIVLTDYMQGQKMLDLVESVKA